MKTINRLDRYYPIIALFVAAVVSFVFWQSCGGGQIPFGITPVQPIQEEEEEPVVEAGLAIKGMVVPPAAGTPSLSAQVNEMLKALTADDFTVTITKGGSEIASCPVVGSSYSCSFSEELVSSGELVEGDILFVSTDNYELQSVCRFSLEPTDECNCGLTDTATTLAYWLTENTVDILSNVSAQVVDNLSDVSPQCELYQKGCEFFRRDLPDVSGPCSFDVDNPPNIYSLNLLKQFYMDNFSEGIKPATLNYLSLDNTTPTRFFEFLWENPEANINALAMLREQFTASIFALAKPWLNDVEPVDETEILTGIEGLILHLMFCDGLNWAQAYELITNKFMAEAFWDFQNAEMGCDDQSIFTADGFSSCKVNTRAGMASKIKIYEQREAVAVGPGQGMLPELGGMKFDTIACIQNVVKDEDLAEYGGDVEALLEDPDLEDALTACMTPCLETFGEFGIYCEFLAELTARETLCGECAGICNMIPHENGLWIPEYESAEWDYCDSEPYPSLPEAVGGHPTPGYQALYIWWPDMPNQVGIMTNVFEKCTFDMEYPCYVEMFQCWSAPPGAKDLMPYDWELTGLTGSGCGFSFMVRDYDQVNEKVVPVLCFTCEVEPGQTCEKCYVPEITIIPIPTT